jgi:hypothetical protein
MNHDFLLHAIALAKRAPLGQSVARSAIGAIAQRGTLAQRAARHSAIDAKGRCLFF